MEEVGESAYKRAQTSMCLERSASKASKASPDALPVPLEYYCGFVLEAAEPWPNKKDKQAMEEECSQEEIQRTLTKLLPNASIRDGIKYGADFLVYLDSPDTVHSSFALSLDYPVSFKMLVALVRVSSSTKKDTVVYTGTPKSPFIQISRFHPSL